MSAATILFSSFGTLFVLQVMLAAAKVQGVPVRRLRGNPFRRSLVAMLRASKALRKM